MSEEVFIAVALPGSDHPTFFLATAEEVAAMQPSPRRRLVKKLAIVERLAEVGLLTAARTALDQVDILVRERWNAMDAVYADDPTTLDFLKWIGADPVVILAP